MRQFLVALLLFGCAGEPESTATKTTTPPPIPTVQTIYDRVHDGPGPIAGLPGFSFVHRPDPNHCSGVAVAIQRTTQPAPEDALIVDVLSIEFPTGLDFTMGEKKEASLNRFSEWTADMTKRGGKANAVYAERLTTGTKTDQVIAAARMVQVHRYVASLFLRAEVPLDVRTGEHANEKRDAFCDRLGEIAGPLVERAEDAAKQCAERAAGIAAGWWTRVCTVTPAVTASVAPSTSP